MKLLISKSVEAGKTELSVHFVTPKENEPFDYVKLIEHLYHNPFEVVELSYNENVTDEEKTKIEEMFEEIKKESQTDRSDGTEPKIEILK